tara:strand:- start:599 stop:1342 length:744 start_codon:yes stop_codon:yes gene_type:complete
MAQFSVPRKDDFTIGGINATYREELDGSRTLKGGGLYRPNFNSGYYARNSLFYPVIEIKNFQGLLLHTIKQSRKKIPESSATAGHTWNFSISENKPYNFLKNNSLIVTVKFVSGVVSVQGGENLNGLLSSNVKNSQLIELVNVQEETRLNNIETERLAVLEKSRLSNIEEKRLADIELRRLTVLKNNMLLLEEIRRNKIDVGEDRLVELLNIEKNQKSKIIPAVVATSGLLPLGIIALLLYSRTGRK